MKYQLILSLALLPFVSCQEFSNKNLAQTANPKLSTGIPQRRQPAATPQAPARPLSFQRDLQKKLPLLTRTARHQGRTYTILQFDSREHQMWLADKLKGPESSWTTAGDAAAENKGLAALNGGFFTPEGKPLGLLSSQGSARGGMNPSSLGSGFYLGGKHPRLIAREEFIQLSQKPADYLQSGPRLVWDHRAKAGLSSEELRARSFLAWDGQNHWLMGYVDSASLAELADDLATAPLADFKIKHALNLDGGRSSDFWISGEVPGGPVQKRLWWNKPVRNYLILSERTP